MIEFQTQASWSTTPLGLPDDRDTPSTVRVTEASLKGALRALLGRSVDRIITRRDAGGPTA